MALTNMRQGEHAIRWRSRSQLPMLWKAPGHGFVTRWGSSRASIIFCEVRFPLASYEKGPLDIWVFPARAKFGFTSASGT